MQSPDNKIPEEYTADRSEGLFKHPHRFLSTTDKWRRYKKPEKVDIEAQPTKILPNLSRPSREPLWEDAAR